MTEQYAKVVLYDLNCDGPNHDRLGFARRTHSDPDGSEYRSDASETVAEARDEARRAGWYISRDGRCLCPECKGKGFRRSREK